VSKQTIVIGSRGSTLALIQSQEVLQALRSCHPARDFIIREIKTKGDRISEIPLYQIGDIGLFVKELEKALLTGEIDMAVHSMKDLPSRLPEGLILGAIPERHSPYDCLVSSISSVEALPEGAVLGTCSLRRKAQILHIRPDLRFVAMRGNLPRRVKKMKEQGLDGIILAEAGLRRLKMTDVAYHALPLSYCVPAAGQGALAVELRASDERTLQLVDGLDHFETRAAVEAERAFMAALTGGPCQVPIACHGCIDDGRLELIGLLASPDGTRIVRGSLDGAPGEAESLGNRLALGLLDQGGRELLNELQHLSSECAESGS
jgi:hydroxymethylbilane synthase